MLTNPLTRRTTDFFVYLDTSSVVRLFQNQIVTLSVDGNWKFNTGSTMHQGEYLFLHILNMFTSILHLKFFPTIDYSNGFIAFSNKTPDFRSSLVELHICVHIFEDVLRLLDGRLNQLRGFFVNVHRIFPIEPVNDKRVSYEQKEMFFIGKSLSLRTN